MNKNLLYLILLFSPHIQSMNADKETKKHPNVTVKDIQNHTNYPIEVVLRANHKIDDLVSYGILRPQTKKEANISIKYSTKDNEYGSLGFKWLKPEASESDSDSSEAYINNIFKNMVEYTPTGNTASLNIALIEDPDKPGKLKMVKAENK